ncbi:MAG: SPOR domain-containing protein [Acidobacteriota bacterium]|nr:SPOR domain-containing protein [Acidobacteriota bacterium]
MLRSGEKETEILLGNKQLLGVFFVAAALLGIAFTGGYMLGRGSIRKTAPTLSSSADPVTQPVAGANPAVSGRGGETHSVAADDSGQTTEREPAPRNSRRNDSEELLGARKKKSASKTSSLEMTEAAVPKASKSEDFVPQGGQEFLQVMAVAREEANGVAAVLRKKGLHAHAVPKPGSANLYRVIVGPIRDAGELSSTRDALRKTGFRDVIVQRYQ